MLATIFLYALLLLTSIGVIFSPLSWAVFFWVLSGHLDMAMPGPVSQSISEIANAFKIVGLPLILVFRLGLSKTIKTSASKPVFILWLIFVFYAAISIVWSPAIFTSDAIKQIGYFVSFTLGFVALLEVCKRELIKDYHIICLILSTAIIACIQTYVLDNPFGSTLFEYSRFVSFTSKQHFAQFLFFMFVLTLFWPKMSFAKKLIFCGILVTEIWLNGSRAAMLGVLCTMCILATYTLFNLKQRYIKRGMVVGIICMIGLVTALSIPSVRDGIYSSRIFEVVRASDNGGIENVGTYRVRMMFWGHVSSLIASNFSLKQHMIGNGLSSSGQLAGSFSHNSTTSSNANRVMHNEFLRSYYELGFLGFMMFITIFLSMPIAILFKYKKTQSHQRLMLFGAYPGMILIIGAENFWVAGSSAGGNAFILLLTLVFTFKPTTRKILHNKINYMSVTSRSV